MQNNLIKRILKNRILIAAVVVAVAVGGYYAYKGANGGNTGVAYETTAVEKGTIVQSVSGSGQVSAETQIDIKPEVSARILDVAVAAGQAVNEGDLLFRLDGTDAQKTVRDAENALESARLSLAKLQAPADALSMLQAQNALKLANESAKSTQDDLDKAYSDGFNAASSVFLDLPTIVNGLDDILYGSNSIVRQSSASYTAYYIDATKNYDAKARQYGEDFSDNYAAAKAAYDKNIQDYKAATIYSDPKTIQSLVEETYATVKAVSEAVKSANNLVQLYKDEMTAQNTAIQSFADTHLTGLGTYTIKVNSETSSLLSAINTIESKKQAVVSASRSIQEKEESLAELKAGADANDLRAQELAVEQRENALMDAKEKLADYTITAPINGTVASVNASVGDSASAGTALAVMITKQQVAEIALNEVDVAEVKAGQKGTVTFDAIDGLTLTGSYRDRRHRHGQPGCGQLQHDRGARCAG